MINTNVYLQSHEVKVRVVLSYGASRSSWVSISEKGGGSDLSFFCDSPESALNLGQAFVTAAPRSTLDITDYKGAPNDNPATVYGGSSGVKPSTEAEAIEESR